MSVISVKEVPWHSLHYFPYLKCSLYESFGNILINYPVLSALFIQRNDRSPVTLPISFVLKTNSSYCINIRWYLNSDLSIARKKSRRIPQNQLIKAPAFEHAFARYVCTKHDEKAWRILRAPDIFSQRRQTSLLLMCLRSAGTALSCSLLVAFVK